MLLALESIFEANRPLIIFAYGLVFFVLGLAIALQSRRHSRLALARSLNWLATFGFIHAFYEWGALFIPIQATYLPEPFVDLLWSLHLGLLAISFACLFQFGVEMLRPLKPRWSVLAWLPAILLTLWALAAMLHLGLRAHDFLAWRVPAGIWARYLLGFPGALLTAYGLRRQAYELIAPIAEPGVVGTLRQAGLALAGYAFFGGLVVPPAEFFPANVLNTAALEALLAVPVPVYRSLLGLTLTWSIVRALEVFEVEADRRIREMEERQILAAERERIGRDLHDRTLQLVFAAGLLIKSGRRALDDAHPSAVPLDQAVRQLDEAARDIRDHIGQLRAEAHACNLRDGLLQLCRERSLSSVIQVDVKLDLPPDHPIPPAEAGHLLAIASEALSNAARHSRASRVDLEARASADGLELLIVDNGVGLPEGHTAGHGLRNMRERAWVLGGSFEIRRRPEGGTSVRVTVPRGENGAA
ncbi:sensor histidine kinase [Limnochorda pilosa]|uniref:histidine kinase n=1 Tax=Limnochorda pilosa TaxID=1555112 RepID=A0A0K2SII3_LIMPI|nr:ATP-binding protein [Limnochorda pilosa]BAS26918.1 periplasmic sensor signal transduction histidine kinase [Limnochorda pilosa]